MKDELINLLKLQDIDNEINKMEVSKERIPEEIDEISNLLVDKKALLEHSKNKLAELEKSKRAIENEIKMEEERIKKDKEKMMQVKSNEEYHAILREIDNSRKEISDRETNILKFMEQMDDAKREIEEGDLQLNKLEVEMNAKNDELNRFLKDVDANISSKTKEREQYLSKIKLPLLKKYDMIKNKKEYPDAVVKVISYSCSACNMHIPHQMVNEIRGSKQIHVCPSCERILYWSEENEKNN